jgi:hypothetical protein
MNGNALKIALAAAAVTVFLAAPEFARYAPDGHSASADAPRAIITNDVAETTRVRVTINGGPALYLRLVGYDDVTGLHRGRNTLVVRWDGPVARLSFRITYSTSPENGKDVLVVRAAAAQDASLRHAGSRTYTFVIPR